MADFDRVAQKYEAIHTANIAMSGEDSYYFARLKASLVRGYLAETGSSRQSLVFVDIGCGTGNLGLAISQEVPDSVALCLDPSYESLKVATARDRADNLYACADGAAMPLAPGIADVAICANVFHHMTGDQVALTLKEAQRVLKPGGLLFVFEHNPLNPLTRYVVSRCEFDKGVTLLWRRQVAALCRAAGLAPVCRRYIVFFPHFLRWFRPLERYLGWLPLGAQHMVVAQKRNLLSSRLP